MLDIEQHDGEAASSTFDPAVLRYDVLLHAGSQRIWKLALCVTLHITHRDCCLEIR